LYLDRKKKGEMKKLKRPVSMMIRQYKRKVREMKELVRIIIKVLVA
jgi:hypothetical protein